MKYVYTHVYNSVFEDCQPSHSDNRKQVDVEGYYIRRKYHKD